MGWLVGWMEIGIVIWKDERMVGNGWMEEWVDNEVVGWMNGWRMRWLDGRMNGWKDE